jgi:hypothetical protein
MILNGDLKSGGPRKNTKTIIPNSRSNNCQSNEEPSSQEAARIAATRTNHEMNEGVEVTLNTFQTSAVDKLLVSSGHFILREHSISNRQIEN